MTAGVGNWIADEVLYQSKLNPQCKTHKLTDEEMERLFNSLRHIISEAVQLRLEEKDFPKDWLFHYRWNKGSKKKSSTDYHGNEISFETIGGRTTATVKTQSKRKRSTFENVTATKDVEQKTTRLKVNKKKKETNKEDEDTTSQKSSRLNSASKD